jgi:hypothetical protein
VWHESSWNKRERHCWGVAQIVGGEWHTYVANMVEVMAEEGESVHKGEHRRLGGLIYIKEQAKSPAQIRMAHG